MGYYNVHKYMEDAYIDRNFMTFGSVLDYLRDFASIPESSIRMLIDPAGVGGGHMVPFKDRLGDAWVVSYHDDEPFPGDGDGMVELKKARTRLSAYRGIDNGL